jgi:hypothetical protein
MPGKRIKEKAPLTAAEKQSRYRQKKNSENQTRHEENIETIRQMLHTVIDKMPENRLIIFCNKLTQTNHLLDEDTLKSMIDLPENEFKKLIKLGVITPEAPPELDTHAFLETIAKYALDNDNI